MTDKEQTVDKMLKVYLNGCERGLSTREIMCNIYDMFNNVNANHGNLEEFVKKAILDLARTYDEYGETMFGDYDTFKECAKKYGVEL